MESLFPALIAAAAIGLTYFVCIRPMRRGQCGMMPHQHDAESDAERDAEVARLRAEIAELRQAQGSSRPGGTAPDISAGGPAEPR